MQDREMPLEGHLEELRNRLVVVVASVVICFIAGFFISRPVLNWIISLSPIHQVVAIGVTEAFFGIVKVDLVLSLVVSSPVWLYEVAAFVFPGLTAREKKVVAIIVGPGLLLFLLGAAAGLLLFFPMIVRVMLSFTGPSIQPMWQLSSYLAFALGISLPFGIIAELPLMAGVLAWMGILSPNFLGRHRRYAVLIAFFIAAVLAPPDALSMVLLAVPLYLIYELAALVARIFYQPREVVESTLAPVEPWEPTS